MRQQPHRLPNAPLVEALVELRWALKPGPNGGQIDPAHPLYVGNLFQAIRENYPFQERLPVAEVPDEMAPYNAKHRFRASADGWPLVQAGPGIVSYNATSDYDWDKFRASAIDLKGHLDAAYAAVTSDASPPDYRHLQLRYISAIKLESGIDPLGFLRERLGTQITLPGPVVASAAGPSVATSVQVSYPLAFNGSIGTVKLGLGAKDERPAMILDISVTASVEGVSGKDLDFSDWLSKAHEASEEWFFSFVEGSLLREFEGGSDHADRT
ncbi:hypothetical protein DMH03_00895 [Amycolatopsis sp. WAC 01376]|uniref:TIGR04255 family protein n=1 Tax=Amycolatopsis sp. WAC 01376 TaxID=2203195 RepID=UPI000F793754|nr:TIGR04255 family protein [Amycolatopsis sp. WAC 01376]RSM65747.1 hypothetical protein DMH03_00895 [Amycolatopsis sp. WAC 01376]